MKPLHAPNIRTADLRAVVVLARSPRFADAAAELGTSQSALTRALKRLERDLGATLFARTTRRVEITQAGREFAAVAKRVLDDLRLAQRQIGEGGRAARVTISTYSAFALHVLPPVVRKFRDTAPSVEIVVRERRQPEIMEDLRRDEADFGIGFVDSIPEMFQSELFRREPLYVVFPARHRLGDRQRRRIRIDDLRDEVLVSPPRDSFIPRLVEAAAGAAGVEIQYRLIVDRFMSVVGYVSAGVGVGIVPEGVLPPRPWSGFDAALLAEPPLSVSVGLIMRRDKYLSPAAQKLVTLIRGTSRSPEPVRVRHRSSGR
jgi:DNA-binding transcriptional LysR family regulator